MATPCSDSGTERLQTRPSARQSNSALPPSCDSMLAITLRVPNPRVAGFSTGGPPVSDHTIFRRLAWFSQLTCSRPDLRRQRAVFGGIGDEFVQGQGNRLCGGGQQLDFRTGQHDLFARRIRRELFVDQSLYFSALPARQRQHGVYPRQRIDPALDRANVGRHVFAARQPDDGLRQRQRILGAVIDFPGQQVLTFFGLLALGDVNGDAADANHAAVLVGARGRRSDAPAYLATRPDDPEFRLV